MTRLNSNYENMPQREKITKPRGSKVAAVRGNEAVWDVRRRKKDIDRTKINVYLGAE